MVKQIHQALLNLVHIRELVVGSEGQDIILLGYPNLTAGTAYHSDAGIGHYGAGKHAYLKGRDLMECSYYNEPPRERVWFGKFDVKRKKRRLIRYLFPVLKSNFK